ncbi:hypothetical protein [Streptomyces sp. H27-D2]|uniref:hypothetical protein n=1 Tax=Streptomyces sp. H27-D2 TaxID=3046304 RepID=UPI002DBD075F|nr:hypothetical protein [Streptomyces sp. H27-D2]MEC4015497.1 hypothetical protein [Streptomyces sp. H27-D2]
MNTALKISAFAAALAATFGTAYGVGGGVDPMTSKDEPAAHAGHGADAGAGESDAAESGGAGKPDSPAGGLQVSEGGYTLALKNSRVQARADGELRFAILDGRGRELTEYRREHGKELHLILAARDLSTYRHLHPTRAADGTWSTPVDLPRAGDYRVFADFTPAAKGAENLTLGADLAASGSYRPSRLPEVSRTAEVDGYTVTLDGALRPGAARELKLKVSKDGKPVTDLDPYLEAYGHLVALRSGDLAYLHVHPNGAPGDGSTEPGPAISFTATAPSSGAYRLFLDFKHEGKVRTAAFTVETGKNGAGDASGAGQEAPKEPEGKGHEH